MINILFSVEKIGPYHNSRFNCIAECKDFKLNILETNIESNSYPWKDNLNQKYKVFELNNKKKKNLKLQIISGVNKVLLATKPDIVFISGWNEKSSHYLLFICQIKKIPVVMLSDSRYKSIKRNIFFEFIKKILLKGCSSAIVAGKESEDYLIRLGFKSSDIFKPYDVVDNKYFFSSDNSRVFNKYILCVSRFLKCKNHIKLLKAFEAYKNNGGYLNLKLIGSGPEKENIIRTKEKLSCAKNISIENWKNISELKNYYSKAKVFVLFSTGDTWGLVINEAMASGLPCIVSKECGCYVDLIKDKNTGWGVNPENEVQLKNIFCKIDKIPKEQFLEKQRNCLKIINNYSLEKFSKAVKDSSINAFKKRKSSKSCLIISYILFLLK